MDDSSQFIENLELCSISYYFFYSLNPQYYAKKSSKDFKGTDTTKAAIESSKKSKGGKKRYLVLSEKDVRILKRDAKVLKFKFFALVY